GSLPRPKQKSRPRFAPQAPALARGAALFSLSNYSIFGHEFHTFLRMRMGPPPRLSFRGSERSEESPEPIAPVCEYVDPLSKVENQISEACARERSGSPLSRGRAGRNRWRISRSDRPGEPRAALTLAIACLLTNTVRSKLRRKVSSPAL